MVVTSEMIRELRERTGVGMAKCKEALVLAEGNMEQAIDILRKAGMAAGVKKEGREAKEGTILALENAKAVLLLEGNAETDFVVQNERFQHFLHDAGIQALHDQVSDLSVLLNSAYSKDPSLTVDQYRNLVIQALGENIQLRRLQLIHKKPHTSYGIYSHMGGKLVVVVEIEGSTGQEAIAREIGMHIAAESPEYLSPAEIPATAMAREEEIARAQVVGKPANITDKIIAGKLQAFQDQTCLIRQKYVKDPSVTIEQFLDTCSKKMKADLSIRCFWRWKVGE